MCACPYVVVSVGSMSVHVSFFFFDLLDVTKLGNKRLFLETEAPAFVICRGFLVPLHATNNESNNKYLPAPAN